MVALELCRHQSVEFINCFLGSNVNSSVFTFLISIVLGEIVSSIVSLLPVGGHRALDLLLELLSSLDCLLVELVHVE